ncbi:SacI homology domain-containing protein [Bisporella sp. PMI_857]|nr:SacI homology domain-containing protein [Bisporella sp. PMI_857]
MPSIVRKLLVFAVIDGIVLQPLAQRGQRPPPATKIAYKNNAITQLPTDGQDLRGSGKTFEAFGIVGLLKVTSSKSFLISITRREQVAQIKGKPIYVITEVALTPLESRAEAESSISHTHDGLQKWNTDDHTSDVSDSEGDAEEFPTVLHDDVDDEPLHVPTGTVSSQTTGEHKRTSSVAEDVISKKGSYGRFARNFFSKKGWNVDQRRNQGMSVSATDPMLPSPDIKTGDGQQSSKSSIMETIRDDDDTKQNDVIEALLPKLLRTTQILFGTSRSFFFSYDYDITRSFANQRTSGYESPLHTRADSLYFWNEHIIQPFIDAGQTSFVLPLLQGFVGQRSFTMDTDPPKHFGIEGTENSTLEMREFPAETDISSTEPEDPDTKQRISKEGRISEKTFLLTLISRRSVMRAGLRYLRRGIDEEGNAANGVETEQILSQPSWAPSSKTHSFVQIRGSIPIFFSQTPYSFKPVPQLQHSADKNFNAFKKHFANISERYGDIEIASLVEKHGNEAIVGDKYQEYMTRFNEENANKSGENAIGFEWFDFHAQCRGMKFENVSILTESLGDRLDSFDHTIECDGQLLNKQSGVLRTNCMDCLDRTNVVQSACGRRALELQLKDEGIDFSLQVDQSGSFFNGLWADNGDAISKQYASTAALKGDFTRTRKRDYKGALTDMGLSISRFYSGIVNDYFSQAAIDFLLGNVTALVFDEFEANMMSGDPGVSMQKLRQQAIDESQKIVIADEHEEFIGGWTLLTPHSPNTTKSMPFEEAVLLLTDSAIYATRFDWNTEKVISFERADLAHILSLKYGTYITSTLSATQTDENKNVGIVITYAAGRDNISRVNTRSLSTTVSSIEESSDASVADITSSPLTANLTNLFAGKPTPPGNKVLAFKALPSQSAVSARHEETRLSELEAVKLICAEIERLVLRARRGRPGHGLTGIVENGTIISLAEARKSTGILEQLGHSLKKLVWA